MYLYKMLRTDILQYLRYRYGYSTEFWNMI